MRKPVIPVSRFKPFIGQPPTAGIPRRSGNGLRVSFQTTTRFVAGAVLAFGGLIVNPAQAVVLKGLKVEQVRNDEIRGRVVKIGAVRTPAASLVGRTLKGIKVFSVRNDIRNGSVSHWLVPHPPRISDTILIHRRTSDFVKRFKPIFWRIPPRTISLTPWRVNSFNVTQRALGRERYNNYRGNVVRTGPRLTGEAAAIVPSISRGIAIARPIARVGNGRVIKFNAPRATFAINAPRTPIFKIYQDFSRINARSPKGAVNRFLPRRHTQICFRPIVVIRGDEIITPGQWHIWQPRRVDFIPSIEQRVPKILRIHRRIVLPTRGYAFRFGPRRTTAAATPTGLNKGFKVSRVRYTSYGSFVGRVLIITPFKRNPPPSGSLNHGLIRLSEFKISLSVKRENDGGKADVFSADATGTVINFNKAFKIVESITVTPLSTALQSAIYDFVHTTQNPTTFKVKLFNSAGSRIDGTISWKARGIL